jgi:hypothetical protein
MADGTLPEETGEGSERRGGKARLISLADLDGRTRSALMARDTLAGLLSDLGGEDVASVAERQIAQRAAVLAAVAEDLEARLLQGDEVDVDELLAVGNAQRRLLATIGLERRSKDVTPSTAAYLAARAAERRAEAAE